MINKQELINEIKANGRLNGLKTDEQTATKIAEKILEENGFETELYTLIWQYADIVKTEEDVNDDEEVTE